MVCEIEGVEENLYVCKARSVLCYLKDAGMTCDDGIVQVQYEVKSCWKTTSRSSVPTGLDHHVRSNVRRGL